ncbi:unnamed protein product [Lymnaea stagnalis]|uniref:Phytanoyl-CoA dioxygenase n=1 Tax=Lymnaea stagnalis TaxID=6523 RepID=A0AAV2HVB1_LYMST
MDAIAIGRPPEGGEEKFWEPEQCWLHCDQSADRIGLHGYQGAVYLEECCDDDWTFEVVEGSHNYFAEFMELIQKPRCTKVSKENLEWFSKRGCLRKRVACPKGGLLLWDSRLLHANARPVRGRSHPGRWRFVIFVCMTPAAWATPVDLEAKVKAYNSLSLTGHWPSSGIVTFSSELKEGSVPDPCPLQKLPEVATTDTARKLAGVTPYDAIEEVPYIPKFDQSKLSQIMK